MVRSQRKTSKKGFFGRTLLMITGIMFIFWCRKAATPTRSTLRLCRLCLRARVSGSSNNSCLKSQGVRINLYQLSRPGSRAWESGSTNISFHFRAQEPGSQQLLRQEHGSVTSRPTNRPTEGQTRSQRSYTSNKESGSTCIKLLLICRVTFSHYCGLFYFSYVIVIMRNNSNYTGIFCTNRI